jgi:hypothetical protein
MARPHHLQVIISWACHRFSYDLSTSPAQSALLGRQGICETATSGRRCLHSIPAKTFLIKVRAQPCYAACRH